MADKAVGVAILDKREYPERLILILKTEGKAPHVSSIPVYEKGQPEPGYAWQYEVVGDRLHITPSLRESTTGPSGELVEKFHNDYSWSVRFELALPGVFEFTQLRKANGISEDEDDLSAIKNWKGEV